MRRNLRHIGDGLLVLALFGVFLLFGEGLNRQSETHFSGRFRVIDGDSLTIDGTRLRMKGIDAPELTQTCRRNEQEWSCGREARDFLASLVSSQTVQCSGAQPDRYKRLLVVCRKGDEDINATMVKEGMAVAYGGYKAEEGAARSAHRGIWAGSFEYPQDVREERHNGQAARWLRDIVPWW